MNDTAIEQTLSGGHVLWTFDGQQPLGPPFWSRLCELARDITLESQSVTLYGGGDFGPGTDLAWLTRELRRAQRGDATRSLASAGEPARAALKCLSALPVPTVALCSGDIVGASAELAVAADFRWCIGRATIRFPEAQLGLLPDFVGIGQLLNALGPQDTRRALMGQEEITASVSTPSPFFDHYAATREEALEAIRRYTDGCARGDVLIELRKCLTRTVAQPATVSSLTNERIASIDDVIRAVHRMAEL
ncbi:enoyl-CoA hydratase/isomerase family protein [Actinoplanes philippinensis]|uniref:enoyl-CoA hydratase/isomerase family protein n=1 Tax=Actinoplanes philippinensis TaxID=35752 RepID=UPI0033D615BD